jgi:hypothetical protein
MPDCREVTTIKRVITVLSGIVAGATNAAGGTYTYGFSATDAVQYGDMAWPPTVDAGQILVVWVGETNEHGIALRDYQPTITLEIHVFVPADDVTPQAKSYAILNALADVRMALEVDQQAGTSGCLGAICDKLVVRSSGEIIGDSFEDMPNLALGVCTLECWFRRRMGVAA